MLTSTSIARKRKQAKPEISIPTAAQLIANGVTVLIDLGQADQRSRSYYRYVVDAVAALRRCIAALPPADSQHRVLFDVVAPAIRSLAQSGDSAAARRLLDAVHHGPMLCELVGLTEASGRALEELGAELNTYSA